MAVALNVNTVPKSKSFVLVIIATPNKNGLNSVKTLAGSPPLSYCKWATPVRESGDQALTKANQLVTDLARHKFLQLVLLKRVGAPHGGKS